MIAKYVIFEHLPRINRKFVPAYNRKTRKSFIRDSKEWKAGAASMKLQVEAQVKETISDKIDVVLLISIPDAEDSDAVIKGLFDALENGGAVENDNQITSYYVRKIPHPRKGEDFAIMELHPKGTLQGIFNWMAEEEIDEEKV